MTNGLVTVGMTAYNAEKTIAETIGSVLGQTYRDFELGRYPPSSRSFRHP